MGKDYLIKEKIENTTSRKIFRVVFYTIIFLFIINQAVFYYLKYNTPNLGYEIAMKKWKMLETMEEKRDWLILGDSTCNQGISAAVLEKKFNASVVNLCTIGDMLAVNDSWMLETYIKKFGAPKNILIIHAYDVWQRKAVNLSLASQLPIAKLIKEKPSPWFLGKKEEATLYRNKYLPLYSQKDSLTSAIVGIVRKEDVRNQRNFDEKGFMSMEYANPETVSVSVEAHKKFLKSNRFAMSSENSASLENIKKLAEKYNFNVFIANSPICEDLIEDENFKIYFSEIARWLTDFASKSDRVYYIDNVISFSKKEMISADHITAVAAQKYSEEISENIIKIINSEK